MFEFEPFWVLRHVDNFNLMSFASFIGTLPAIIFSCVVGLIALVDSLDMFTSYNRTVLTMFTTR